MLVRPTCSRSPMDSLKETHQDTLQQRTPECTFYKKKKKSYAQTLKQKTSKPKGKGQILHRTIQTSLKKKQVIRWKSSAEHCDVVGKTASSQLHVSTLTASVLVWQRSCVYTVNTKITYNGDTSPSICQRSLKIEHFASVPPLIQRHANLLTVTQHQEVWILLIEGYQTRFVKTR